MRAILLASATATSLTWQRCNNRIGRYICIFQQLRQAPRDDFAPLRKDDAVLRQNPPHVIVQGNPLAHQQTTTMVQVQDGLLLGRLGLDKPHASTAGLPRRWLVHHYGRSCWISGTV